MAIFEDAELFIGNCKWLGPKPTIFGTFRVIREKFAKSDHR